MVCCKIRLQPKMIHRAKPAGKKRIDASKTQHLKKAKLFEETLENSLQTNPPKGDAQQKWNHLEDVIHDTALSVFS